MAKKNIIVAGVFLYLLFCFFVIHDYEWLGAHYFTITAWKIWAIQQAEQTIYLDDLGYVLAMSGGVVITGYISFISNVLMRIALARIMINSAFTDIVMVIWCANDYSAFAWLINILVIIGLAFYAFKKLY